ncbi:MAG: lysylphosphatidylglycerol synthase domain-containing protein [Nitrospirales bacterium]
MRLLPFVLLLMGLIMVAFSYFISPSLQSSLRGLIERLLRSKGKWQRINSFFENFSLENTSVSLYGSILSIGLLWQLLFLGRMFLLFHALLLPLGFIDVVWMSSLVLLLQILPISLGGIGVREGAYAYLFTLLNLPPEQGVLIGILFFSQMLLFALIGGILELLEG